VRAAPFFKVYHQAVTAAPRLLLPNLTEPRSRFAGPVDQGAAIYVIALKDDIRIFAVMSAL